MTNSEMNAKLRDFFKLPEPKDRESYLAWVKEWKALYRELTLFIRKLRTTRKQYIWKRTEANGYTDPSGKFIRMNKKYEQVGPNPNHDSSANYWIARFSASAASMLELRAMQKENARKRMTEKRAA